MNTAIAHDVQAIRARAAEAWTQLGWPTTRIEEWRYTNLAPLARQSWQRCGTDNPLGPEQAGLPVLQASLCGRAVAELVFVNGVYAPEACSGSGSSGITVSTLKNAPQELVTAHFGKIADFERNAMTALNTVESADGAVIEVSDAIEGFVHVLYIGTSGYESHPRNLIVAGRNSQLTVIESYVGSGAYFTNTVTEIIAAENAVVDHYKLICESRDAYHIGTTYSRQARSSNLTSRNISVGGKLVRSDVYGALVGEGATITLDGLYVASENQHVDQHTVIDHAAPHCDSIELYKGVLDSNGRGIFDGRIIVRPGAIKTNSKQENHNLLLSETAIADSKPTLEIHNDDVKCSHGSTIGQIAEEPMFYLRSRGIGEEEARNLLVYAFAGEIVDRMKVEPIAEQVRRALFASMPERLPERRAERGGRSAEEGDTKR